MQGFFIFLRFFFLVLMCTTEHIANFTPPLGLVVNRKFEKYSADARLPIKVLFAYLQLVLLQGITKI